MITSKGQAVDRAVTASLIVQRASQQTRPVLCPTHQQPLEGGPIRYRCPAGHGVTAADIDHDYHPPGGAR